jgi:hypothetical protein
LQTEVGVLEKIPLYILDNQNPKRTRPTEKEAFGKAANEERVEAISTAFLSRTLLLSSRNRNRP